MSELTGRSHLVSAGRHMLRRSNRDTQVGGESIFPVASRQRSGLHVWAPRADPHRRVSAGMFTLRL